MKKNLNLRDILCFLGMLFIQITYTADNIPYLLPYFQPIKFIGIIFLFTTFLLGYNELKIKKKDAILLFGLFSILIFIFLKFSKLFVLELFAMILVAMTYKFDDLVKKDLIIKILLIGFIVANNLLGKTVGLHEKITRGTKVRNSFGFFHPNTFAMYSIMALIDYIYLKRNNINFINAIITLGLSILVLYFTDSRSSFGLFIIAYLGIIYSSKFNKSNRKNKFVEFIVKNMYVILLIFTLGISYLYTMGNSMAMKFDQLLTTRVQIQAKYLETYSINLFGNQIEFFKTLDNGFLRNILNYGLVLTIIFVIIYIFNIKRSIKDGDKIHIIFLSLMIFSLSESSMFFVAYNIFWIYYFSIPKEKLSEENNSDNTTNCLDDGNI